MFETQIRSYQGDDPLDPWDRLVFALYLQGLRKAAGAASMTCSCCRYLQWVEGAFPLPSGQEHLSALLEQLVKVFIGYKRYHQDTRFVKHCIKLAEFISSPSQFFDFIYSQGVGTRTSGLYIAWAQQLETEGNMQHAGAVLQKGIHNQAEPVGSLQEQYRLFQSRIPRSQPLTQGEAKAELAMKCTHLKGITCHSF
uniref:BUB1 N-terminal domain-containing protein n=1 Tax=Pelusios castaneus TaxID=367368 RepID=A0A8C8S0L1_9SAUR